MHARKGVAPRDGVEVGRRLKEASAQEGKGESP